MRNYPCVANNFFLQFMRKWTVIEKSSGIEGFFFLILSKVETVLSPIMS